MKQFQKTVSVRELQHNLSDILEMAKSIPVIITKHGKDEILLSNPKEYELTKIHRNKLKNKDIMNSEFIGFHKNNSDYENKSSAEIASDLRERAFYGK